jgi:membrane protease YdiL (CAAX protease family)
MLAAMAFTLQVADIVLLAAGGLCCLAVAVWLIRSGKWRNPLTGVELPRQGPTIAGAAAVLLAFFSLQFVALSALGGAGTPGSAAWHRMAVADSAISLMVSALMLILLNLARPQTAAASVVLTPPATPTRCSARASLLASLVALLALLPITWALLELGQMVWQWLNPGATPPVHAVLQALRQSEWGVWGTLQLVVGAVVVAPLVEELFFRGVLLQSICFHVPSAWAAVSLSAAAFGLVHSSQPQDVLPLATMGLVLGCLRLHTGRLWPCVLLHMLFNARTMTFVILAPELLEQS